MADIFTDSDDENALKEILSQAMDMAILEQVAAINNAGRNSYLSSDLETRFQNLKNFQPSMIKPASSPTKSFNLPHSSQFKKSDCVNKTKNSDFSDRKNVEQIGKGVKKFEKCRNGVAQCVKKSPETMTCVSPPVKSGCFSCFSSKLSRRKSNGNRDFGTGLDHDQFLSGLNNFSVKSQQKMMKKAVKEEEKIRREAEKIVKLVKHASAGMDVSDMAK